MGSTASTSSPQLSPSQDVWLLGKCYAPGTDQENPWADLQADWTSRIWVTYRRDFPELQGAVRGVSTDAGWGCMIRTGQMMLAHTLLVHYNGRDWRWHGPTDAQGDQAARHHAQILEWLADAPSAPFSLHNLVYMGTQSVAGKTVGDWFGPGEIFNVMAALVDIHRPAGLAIYRSDDQTIYRDDVVALMQQSARRDASATASAPKAAAAAAADAGPESNSSDAVAAAAPPDSTASGCAARPVLLIVHAKYGSSKVNPRYEPALLSLFQWPEFIGIGGGKPRSSHYFIGAQADHLLYLDPHTTQPAAEPGSVDASTFHCSSIRSIKVGEADPSMVLGFYVSDVESLHRLCDRIAQHAQTFATFAVLSVGATKPAYDDLDDRIIDFGDDGDDVVVL